MTVRWPLVVVLIACLGCERGAQHGPDGRAPAEDMSLVFPGAPDLLAADLLEPDLPPPPFMGAVYAHSAAELYSVDPQTLDISLVGKFTFGGLSEGDPITDIALDRNGDMVGISYETLYRIDRKTAACTRLAAIGQTFNALSYVAEDQVDQQGGAEEILLAANRGGELYRLDPRTGAATRMGSYGDGLLSSGDLVSVKGLGTLATVKRDEAGGDFLARIDLRKGGRATIIGETGDTEIYGLGFWADRVFGFTENRRFVVLDVKTGAARLVRTTMPWWWGAGVSTWAPVTIQ